MSEEITKFFDDALKKASEKPWKPSAKLLLHPPLPPPLHGTNPRTILGQKWWDVERRKAYAKHGYRCWACGVNKEEQIGRQVLDAHEDYVFNYECHRITLREIVALCVTCHAFIHCNRMNSLYDKGVINEEECCEILRHGYRTLLNQGMEPNRLPHPAYYKGDWDKWHLVLEGKEYYSKFRDEEEWAEFYRNKNGS